MNITSPTAIRIKELLTAQDPLLIINKDLIYNLNYINQVYLDEAKEIYNKIQDAMEDKEEIYCIMYDVFQEYYSDITFDDVIINNIKNLSEYVYTLLEDLKNDESMNDLKQYELQKKWVYE